MRRHHLVLSVRPVVASLGAAVLAGLFAPTMALAADAAPASQTSDPSPQAQPPAPVGGTLAPGDTGTGKKMVQGKGNRVEEIVVTGRKIEERLQDVPIAVSAVTSKQIQALQPTTLEDFNGQAPNTFIGRVGAGAGSAAIYIRGLGYSDIEKGQNPAVGLLIDDVVIGTNTAQLINAFDISQVEIYRGPQGIYFGKNTTGGAISVHRSTPTHQWGLKADVAYGDYDQIKAQFVANAPIGPDAGLKVAFSYNGRSGFDDNIYTGNTGYGKNTIINTNVMFDWKPIPTLDLLASLDFTNQYGEGTPVALGDPVTAKILAPALVPFGFRFNEWGSPYIPGVTVPLGPHQVANDFPDRNNLTQERYSFIANWDTPYGRFTSITAYIDQNDDAEQDFDGSCGISELNGPPCPVVANPILGPGFLHTSRPQHYTQFTEEDRFTHDFGSTAKLLVGIYYFHHNISALQLTRTSVEGVPVRVPFTNQISGESNSSISGFGNIDWYATSKLTLSAGIRYISESTDYNNQFNLLYVPGVGPAYVPLVPQFFENGSWGHAIWRFSADYKLTETNMLYASASQGFRSGGFSPRATLSESIPGQTNYSPGANYTEFNPETNTAYEIGSKNQFLNYQVTLNLAAFLTEDSNHQGSFVVVTPGYGPGTNTYINNIPKVRIYGFEGELIYKPEYFTGFTFDFTAGYQNAEITNGVLPGVRAPVNPDGTAGAPGTTYDLTGQQLERVPQFTMGIIGDYNHRWGPGSIDANIQYHYQSSFSFGTFAGLQDIQPAYGLLDLSLAYSWDRFRLTFSMKNATNVAYRSNSLPVVYFQGWGDPRTFLFDISAAF